MSVRQRIMAISIRDLTRQMESTARLDILMLSPVTMSTIYLLESGSLRGPVAQLVRAGDSSHQVRLPRKSQNERDEFRETLTVRLMAILSQAASTLAEGAETTWGLERP